jgi:hypothetical protein
VYERGLLQCEVEVRLSKRGGLWGWEGATGAVCDEAVGVLWLQDGGVAIEGAGPGSRTRLDEAR